MTFRPHEEVAVDVVRRLLDRWTPVTKDPPVWTRGPKVWQGEAFAPDYEPMTEDERALIEAMQTELTYTSTDKWPD